MQPFCSLQVVTELARRAELLLAWLADAAAVAAATAPHASFRQQQQTVKLCGGQGTASASALAAIPLVLTLSPAATMEAASAPSSALDQTHPSSVMGRHQQEHAGVLYGCGGGDGDGSIDR